MSLPTKSRFDPQFPLVDRSGNATQQFRDYLLALDRLVTAMAAGNLPVLVNAANDAAAAAAGVAIGQEYRTGNALQVRLV